MIMNLPNYVVIKMINRHGTISTDRLRQVKKFVFLTKAIETDNEEDKKSG